MLIHYYEAALSSVFPAASPRATLDDIHCYAWSLFVHGRPSRAPRMRPFVFRIDALPQRRSLWTLRARQFFPGAEPRRLDLKAGMILTLDLAMIPTRRRQRIEYTPQFTEWPDLWCAKLEAVGFKPFVDHIVLEPIEHRRWRVGQPALAIINGRVTGEITDVPKLATAWTDGVGRRKAYGLGLLRLAPAGAQDGL